MKRGGFKRATFERRPVVILPASRAGQYARADEASQPHLKSEPTRPGKRTPTAEESRWMDAVARLGCIACRLDGRRGVPCAIHHLLSGGQRRGHLFTIGLCDPGHHQNGAQFGVVSRHPWRVRFEKAYGSEDELLQLTREILCWNPPNLQECREGEGETARAAGEQEPANV